MPVAESEIASHFISKSKEVEKAYPYDARCWLLMGKSLLSSNFEIQYEAYLLEQRQKNAEGAAQCFSLMFPKFESYLKDEISRLADALRTVHLMKGKETAEQTFLHEIFVYLPKEIQIEILIRRSDQSPVVYEKCQYMILLVKLYPETLNQHGGELLLALLACETDAFSTFRKLLVVELVPSFLQLSGNLGASSILSTLLKQCIEYYVLVAGTSHCQSTEDDENEEAPKSNNRWSSLFSIFDKIGKILGWSLAPFFSSLNQLDPNSSNGIDSLYQAMGEIYLNRNRYNCTELAYLSIVVFLRSIVGYYELRESPPNLNCQEKNKMILVEVFVPKPHSYHEKDSASHPTSITASPCSSFQSSSIITLFLTAVKVWEAINVKGDQLEKEFHAILSSLKSINLDGWDPFKEFVLDYQTYIGHHCPPNDATFNPFKLASMNFSMKNYKEAVENIVVGLRNFLAKEQTAGSIPSTPRTTSSSSNSNSSSPTKIFRDSRSLSTSGFSGPILITNRDDFSFFNSHIYGSDEEGQYVWRRRVHLLSENKSELIVYSCNILINCLYMPVSSGDNNISDTVLGHLMALLQLEWPSAISEMIFDDILTNIKRKKQFHYFPYFESYILEPDFLEEFMTIANLEGKAVSLDIWAPIATTPSGTRRMGTRGVEKGVRDDFKQAMKRQIMRSGKENIEYLISELILNHMKDVI